MKNGVATASTEDSSRSAATRRERVLAPGAAPAVPGGPFDDPFRQDELSDTPLLFRYGPWALILGGLVLSVGFFVAGQWRVDAGRQGVYDSALHFASTTASAAVENVSQVLARLRQAVFDVELLRYTEAPLDHLREAFEKGLGMRGEGIEAIALSESGELVMSTILEPHATKLARHVWSMDQMRQESSQFMLPAVPGTSAGRSTVPVLQRVRHFEQVAWIAFLVDSELFTAIARKAFGDRLGWLKVEDEFGRALLETEPMAGTLGQPEPSARRQVYSAQDAMGTPLDFNSRRMLVAATPVNRDGITVVAGQRESDVLAEFKQRVEATWLIAAVASTILLSLVGLTATALRKFARKEAYLRRLATVDILSDLPNRRSFYHLLGRAVRGAIQSGSALALYHVDLDNFKYVNDSLGHEAGDNLLRYTATVLSREAGPEGTVCRLGGDEFTVVMPGIGSALEAQEVGDRFVTALLEPFHLGATEIQPRASIGVALLPLQAFGVSDLMRFADTAMYRAKEEGKGRCVIYGETMATQELAKARAVRELERSISNQDFFLLYQPKFETISGNLCGFEALVRWQHPQRGVVLPSDFIGLAEESGLIYDLGNWVLERAARQLRQWHIAGLGWQQVAVNLSPLQLRGKEIVERVASLLDTYKIPGSSLQLELTEGSLAADTGRAQHLIRALRELGVSIAVDDFGTGYSSMGALQRFDLDFLKVDRSFVRVLHTPHGQEICRAVISLGHALKMKVIAEGVETPEQRSVLARLGCDEIQGYLYSIPLAAEEAGELARCGFMPALWRPRSDRDAEVGLSTAGRPRQASLPPVGQGDARPEG